MIVAENLEKKFGDLTVLKDINLTIEDGDIYGLVGRSGAGKSTLLRCINGLESYDSGNLIVNGIEVKENSSKKSAREFRKGIGMIFQHFSLLERRSVYDNIATPMRCWHHSKKVIDSRVRELLQLVDLEHKIDQKPRHLSGGQKQRVAIARALTLNPSILLCDEATSALDPKTTKSILALLREINEKLGITIVVVTHQMSVVREVCNKVSILENGKIAEAGEVETIFMHQPPALKRIVGRKELLLLEGGKNIQILLTSDLNRQGFLTAMAIDLNMVFPIIGGTIEKYRDDFLGSFVLNLSDEQYPIVIDYLNKRNIAWQEVEELNESEEI